MGGSVESRYAELHRSLHDCHRPPFQCVQIAPAEYRCDGRGDRHFCFHNAVGLLWVYSVRALPGFILSYVNGNNHPWYFSIFPWAAFTLAGITFGYVLLEAKHRMDEPDFFKRVAAAGVCFYALGAVLGFVDYSFTSPHYFFVQLGWLLLIVYSAYLWSQRVTANRWSPLIVLGQSSLIVYWVHIEIVYGKVFRDFSQSLEVSAAARHVLWFVPLMILLASARSIRPVVMDVARRMPFPAFPRRGVCVGENPGQTGQTRISATQEITV